MSVAAQFRMLQGLSKTVQHLEKARDTCNKLSAVASPLQQGPQGRLPGRMSATLHQCISFHTAVDGHRLFMLMHTQLEVFLKLHRLSPHVQRDISSDRTYQRCAQEGLTASVTQLQGELEGWPQATHTGVQTHAG